MRHTRIRADIKLVMLIAVVVIGLIGGVPVGLLELAKVVAV